MSVRYRIAENKWNTFTAPWNDAIGIEEIGGNEYMAVPPVVMWFTRNYSSMELATQVVDLLNSAQKAAE